MKASRLPEIVRLYGARVQRDLGIAAFQAAGLFGNGDVESQGYNTLQEIAPLVEGSAGGYGWMQWTGPRRREYLAFCQDRGQMPSSDEMNYRFMILELQTDERTALAALKASKSVEEAAAAVCQRYLRPGIPHLDRRIASARTALALLGGHTVVEGDYVVGAPKGAGPAPKREWAEASLPKFAVRGIQQRLIDLGYHDVGLVDGIWGTKLGTAIGQLQERAVATGASVTVDKHYGPQTEDLLDEKHGDTFRNVVSESRASITAHDLARAGTPAVVSGRKITWASFGSILAAAGAFVVALIQGWQAQPELPWYAQTVMGFLPPWVIPLVPIVCNIYTVAKTQGLIGSSVERVREGIDNSGAPPAGPVPIALPWPLSLVTGK